MNETTSTSVDELIGMLLQGTAHIHRMGTGLETPWNPLPGDFRRLHNMYVRNLVTSYVSRFAELCNGLLVGLEKQDYLVYALCGRALIETAAVLRYYVLREYKPLFDKRSLDEFDMKKLVEIDDQHLRGSGFDWMAFALKRYSKLRDSARARRKHGPVRRRQDAGSLPKKMPVGRCIDSWSKEDPNIGVAYDLFCDMVHPSAGCSFLVASTGPDGLFFTKSRGHRVGTAIVEQSLPLLLSITQRPFGEYLAALLGTMWLEDELR